MSITVALIIVNVIIFFIMEGVGDTESALFMMEH